MFFCKRRSRIMSTVNIDFLMGSAVLALHIICYTTTVTPIFSKFGKTIGLLITLFINNYYILNTVKCVKIVKTAKTFKTFKSAKMC